MEEKLLTIVVPSYNTSNYIDQCINSLVQIPNELLEVLIVDDGSKDDTLVKAEAYQAKYPNIVKAVHKENSGHGSTINLGLSIARGKYIRVLDGDDWVDSKALDQFIKRLASQDCDMLLTEIVQVFPDKQNLQRFFVELERDKVYEIDSLPQIDFLTLGSITVKTEILKEHGLKLTEKCFYEDIEFCAFCLAYVHNVCVYNLPVYMYRLGNENQSVAKSNMVKNIEMFKRISIGLLPFYEMNKPKVDNSRNQLMLLRIGKMVRTTMLLHLADSDTERGFSKWKEYTRKVYKSSPAVFKYINKKWKIIRILCTGNKFVFKVMSKVYRRKFSIN